MNEKRTCPQHGRTGRPGDRAIARGADATSAYCSAGGREKAPQEVVTKRNILLLIKIFRRLRRRYCIDFSATKALQNGALAKRSVSVGVGGWVAIMAVSGLR